MSDFGRLLEKAIRRLRRYARALTRDVSRADDLVQDTLVRAIAQQHHWQCGTDLRAWLFTIMHNQNVSGVRRSRREGIAVEFDDKWPSPTAISDPTGRLLLRDLDRALARISEEQRQVILLIGLEGTSYEEAATILNVPLGTIRSRVFQGRKSLRKLMDRRPESEVTVRLSRAPRQSAGALSLKISQLRIFLGRRRNRRSRYLPRPLSVNVADEPSVKAACIVGGKRPPE
jgi:RNA polymerase sigma-70 factor, ECF subfamily